MKNSFTLLLTIFINDIWKCINKPSSSNVCCSNCNDEFDCTILEYSECILNENCYWNNTDIDFDTVNELQDAIDNDLINMDFYTDGNFTNLWDTDSLSTKFNVARTGTVGITADAKVTLEVTKNIPEVLYYRLDPVYEANIPVV